MLNVHLIERHVRRAQWDQLIAAVSENGAMIPLSLRARLARVSSVSPGQSRARDNSNAPAGAVGVRSSASGGTGSGEHRSAGRFSGASAGALALALHRLVELTYGPTSLSREIIDRLLDEQSDNGSFGEDVATTCAAVAALGRVIAEHANLDPREHQRLVAAREHALACLAATQSDNGLFHSGDDRTEQDRALTAAFVLAYLADDEAFRMAVRFADLMNWFESHQDDLEPATDRLWQLALAGAPAHGPTTPVLAAIAA